MTCTSERIKSAITHFENLRDTLGASDLLVDDLTSDILAMELNYLSYYLDGALEEAYGDENVLKLRDRVIDRKRTRIKDLEDELQNCYKALKGMSDQCDELQAKLTKQNGIILKLLYDEPIF